MERNQRCLIPVSGTYEHGKIMGWSKKVPHYIAEKGRDIFYIRGLYHMKRWMRMAWWRKWGTGKLSAPQLSEIPAIAVPRRNN